MMSIEAQVEELYGDSKDDAWKQEEIARLKAEQGIAKVEEPGINTAAGSFQLNMKGGKPDEGQGNEPSVSDEPEGVPGTAAGGKGTGTTGYLTQLRSRGTRNCVAINAAA